MRAREQQTEATAGPWEMRPSEEGANSKRVFSGGGEYIATVGGSDQPSETVVDNARLIAAAPDLLDACRAALARFEVEQSFGPHRQKLYAAIEKAQGSYW